MATLPDLDTSTVGFIAYWNAIDSGGVGSIEASDCLSDGSIQEYTLYDNGFTAQYTLSTGRTATVRVKQDGWFVAYIDQSQAITTDTTDKSAVAGPWDIVSGWSDGGGTAASLTNNSLERAINSLQSNLSNSGSVTYNATDVGLYDYANTSATTVTALSAAVSNASKTCGFIYTSDTTRHTHVGVGSGNQPSYAGTSASILGTQIFSESGGTDHARKTHYGAYDILANGAAPNSGTEYQCSLSTGSSSYGSGTATVTVFAVWS